MRSAWALPLALVLACAAAAPVPPTPYARIATERGEVLVRLEIADTDEARLVGLMRRDALARDAGMVSSGQRKTESRFHMRDTRIPLSIAFFDADGSILRILDVEPCRADPCPIYEAGVRYRGHARGQPRAFTFREPPARPLVPSRPSSLDAEGRRTTAQFPEPDARQRPGQNRAGRPLPHRRTRRA